MSRARANSKLTTEQEVEYKTEMAKRTNKMAKLTQLMDQHPLPFWFVTVTSTITMLNAIVQLVHTISKW